MSSHVSSIMSSFYALEDCFTEAINKGLLIPVRDEDGNFVEFGIAERGDAENMRVRERIAISAFLDYRNRFVEQVAEQYRTYVWFASMGEARHTASQSTQEYPCVIPQGGSRESVCRSAWRFEPTRHNREILEEVFDPNCWGGSFGGGAWQQIVHSLKYYSISKVVFIDLVNDLEHNNGTVFNKSEAASYAGLNLERRGSIHSLLDYKKYNRITQDGTYRFRVFRKTATICNAVLRIMGDKTIPISELEHWVRYDLSEWTPTQWGDECLDDEGFDQGEPPYRCESCGEGIYHGDDRVKVAWDVYCQSCADQFLFECVHCGDMSSDESEIDGVCDYCYTHNYTECGKCGGMWHNHDLELHEVNGVDMDLCEDCRDDLHTCKHCDTQVWFSETDYVHHLKQQIPLCEYHTSEYKASGFNRYQTEFFEAVK